MIHLSEEKISCMVRNEIERFKKEYVENDNNRRELNNLQAEVRSLRDLISSLQQQIQTKSMVAPTFLQDIQRIKGTLRGIEG